MAPSSGAQAVALAMQWLGTPYQWGGGHSGPVPVGTPVDCSGLVDQVFGVTGNTGTQIRMGSAVSGVANAQPGDLVFFGPIAPGEPYHVGIYSGAGMMIDAPNTGSVVRFDNVSGFGQVDGVRRLVTSSNQTGPSVAGGSVTYNYAQLEGIWIQAGGNSQAAPMAAAIAMAESGGNSAAQDLDSNGSVDRGLWQINSVHGSQSTFDVMGNARAAVAISNNGTDWSPWVTYQTGAYKQFLQSGVAPDTTAPINGTAAAAGTGNQTAQLESCGMWENILIPGSCLIQGGGVDPLSGAGIADSIVKGLVTGLINPFIQIIAGVMGITGGLLIMVGGMFLIVKDSSAYQSVKSTKAGAEDSLSWLAGPEAGAAVNAGNATKQQRPPTQRQQQQGTADQMRAEAARYRRYNSSLAEHPPL
jgi:hypothetical protein